MLRFVMLQSEDKMFILNIMESIIGRTTSNYNEASRCGT